MCLPARAVATILASTVLCAVAQAQTGPTDPEIIAGARTARISLGGKKPEGFLTGTVRVTEDGRVRDVLVTENTSDGLEQELVKVLESARFRPAIDASGRPVEGSIEMKVELRESTGSEPKPARAKPDAQLADKEKARIKRMRCSDFLWEWNLLREQSDDPAAIEFMPRMATAMYASLRSEAGDYVDAKVWKASPKALREAADQCKDNPGAPFWDGIFKSVMDEAVPK